MFSSSGLFKEVPCPNLGHCLLINCIFSHDQDLPIALQETIRAAEPAEKEQSNGSFEDTNAHEHQRKRRRISSETPAKSNQDARPRIPPNITEAEASIKSRKDEVTVIVHGEKSGPRKGTHAAIESKARPISPPPVKPVNKSMSQQTAPSTNPRLVQTKKEALIPRPLDHAPASHPIRMALLQKLHATMSALNDKAAKDPGTDRPFLLSADELITMALDEEETTAKEKPTIYTNVVKSFIMQLNKMDLAAWRKQVAEVFKGKFMPTEELPHKKPTEKIISTGLTPLQEVMVLRQIRTPLEGLEGHGYVTRPPTAEEIKAATEGVEAAQGFETCERCRTRFQVFPGRREEDGALTSGGTCTYHWAKPIRPQRQRTDHITGHREAYWPCCNEGMSDSNGCTKSPHHVFKVSEVKRLASIMQFERTPETPADQSHPKPLAVAFDAEMGYTTLGMEMIRLTAVSWPSGESLLDVLVRPIGEFLDLNTRFSGITLSQMANAPPFSDLSPKLTSTSISSSSPTKSTTTTATHPSVSEDGEILDRPTRPPPPLRIVPSPQAARTLLFSLLTPQTPLIGHAIDNDLNVTRIIHPFIIDTVLLYPHPRGLPARLGLKALASRHLDRDIQRVSFGSEDSQGSGIKGHDSKEDAVATADLVRVKVAEKWKAMKKAGWRFEGDRLVDPREREKEAEPQREEVVKTL